MRIAILSDIHGNLLAFEAALKHVASYPLGTDVLLKERKVLEPLLKWRKEIDRLARNWNWPSSELIQTIETPTLLGSTATKLAWLKNRKQTDARYNSAKVHGKVLMLSEVNAA